MQTSFSEFLDILINLIEKDNIRKHSISLSLNPVIITEMFVRKKEIGPHPTWNHRGDVQLLGLTSWQAMEQCKEQAQSRKEAQG